MRTLGVTLAVVISMSCFSTVLCAQGAGRGSISGTVRDSAAAVIPNATVTVRNIDTNLAVSTVTKETGYYEVDEIIPGTYSVSIDVPGFTPYVRKGITVTAGGRVVADIALKVGSSETIVVTADAALLNTESGSAGETLNVKSLSTLPVSGANASYLMKIAEGVQAQEPQNYYMAGNLHAVSSISGFGTSGHLYANEFSLDGAPNMGYTRNIAYGPSTDEIDQLKADVAGFDPQVGHTLGAYVTATSKAGTNLLHGTLRNEYNDRRWEAMTHFQRATYITQTTAACASGASAACTAAKRQFGQPGIHENNGGFSVGGPVFIPKLYDGRNKLFFFVAFTDDVFTDSSSITASVPTAQERTGNFSDLPTTTGTGPCGSSYANYGAYQIYDPLTVTADTANPGHYVRTPFCGNVIPSTRLKSNPVASFMNAQLPTPTSTNIINNYVYNRLNPQTYRAFTERTDFDPSDRNRFFFRYTHSHYLAHQHGELVGNYDETDNERTAYLGTFGYIHTFSPSTLLDISVGGTNYWNQTPYPNERKEKPSSLGLPSYLDQYSGTNAEMPIFNWGSSSYTNIGYADTGKVHYRTLAVHANVTHILARHSLHSGFEYRIQNSAGGGPGNQSGTFTFDDTYVQATENARIAANQAGLSYASFLLGIPTTASAGLQPQRSRTNPYYAIYAGDTWRITPKLTLLPGIRFEYEYGAAEKYNHQMVGFDPNAASPIASLAQTAYAASPASQVPAASFVVTGAPLYAGVNGAPTKAWQDNYRFLPRLGVAYQLNNKTVIRGGYGLFFDTLNALNEYTEQNGYAATTTTTFSTDYGQTWASGNPAGGVSPMTDPFPTLTGGGHFLSPVGSALGALSYAGSGFSFYPNNRVPAREQRASISIQRQLTPSMMLEVGYTGALVTNITIDNGSNSTQTQTGAAQKLTYVPASYYGTGQTRATAQNTLLTTTYPNPFYIGNLSSYASTNASQYNYIASQGFYKSKTISLANLLMAYPQMNGVTIYAPRGESKYHSLTASLTRRQANGLTMNVAFQMNDQWDRDYYANAFDQNPSWEQSNQSRPYRFTTSGSYELPLGHNKKWATSGWQSKAFGGLQLDGTYEVQPGALIAFPNAFYTGDLNSIGKSNPSYTQWFNTSGFVTSTSSAPNSYNVRVFPTRVKGVRQQGPNTWYGNLQRTIPIYDRAKFEARFECFNIFNRNIVGAPDATPTDSTFGQSTSDYQAFGRFIQIQGRITF